MQRGNRKQPYRRIKARCILLKLLTTFLLFMVLLTLCPEQEPDNAAMEAINGWIKDEMFMDMHITGERPVEQEIDEYIVFFNEQRPAYSLGYLTPKQYRVSYEEATSV